MKKGWLIICILMSSIVQAQTRNYPKGYFRNPMNIHMELVANFGELRTNHWHMGLDIRTQQRENLPVYAAADGYIARIKIEPGGFGRAIYINHPNGYTTLYAHLNNFTPALEQWVKTQQYNKESWAVELAPPSNLFPVAKGDFIAYSGNTGGSAGPHVHFEIRDTKTEKCLNPLLFGFPIADAVAPPIQRIAMYDRNRSVYDQTPQQLGLRRSGNNYTLSPSGLIKVGTDKVSFALGMVDFFTGSTNPNGVYSARILLDGILQSEFILDNIGYDETRYMNAHTDFRYKAVGGPWLQHVSRLPGDFTFIYTPEDKDGIIELQDTDPHSVRIEVRDAAQNLSTLNFNLQYNPAFPAPSAPAGQRWMPRQVNIFESENFEAFSTERTLYDAVTVTFSAKPGSNTASSLFTFMGASIPVHDHVTVRIKPNFPISAEDRNKVIIRSISGSRTLVQKAAWQGEWVWSNFRQFGTYQAFVDNIPPVINTPPTDLRKATKLVFTPTDNFNTIKRFRATLNGKWLRFTNDKGRNWIYTFDENFPPGQHELKVIVEDEAGNVTERTWTVNR